MREVKFLKQLAGEMKVKGSWSLEEVQKKIEAKIVWAEKEEGRIKDVEDLRINDFFSYNIQKVPHPCVIFAMDESCVWGIITSTNEEGCHNVAPIEGSRMLRDGWWTNTIICAPKEQAMNSWLGIFDNPKDVKKAVTVLKEYYKKLLK